MRIYDDANTAKNNFLNGFQLFIVCKLILRPTKGASVAKFTDNEN